MNLIYGTYNPSKLESMIKILDGLNLRITDLGTIDIEIKEAEETGKDPLSNATQKAMSYFEQIKQPIFSCDSGLYFEDVDEKDQPGVLIKRIHGKNLAYREGFPLDSLSVEMESMKYYYDLEGKESEKLGVIHGFRNFFIRSINDYLKTDSL